MAKKIKWLENAVFYQLYPQSFNDTNADGIGDIPGIIEKLDYIRSLGVSVIWLNPCFASPFYDAGYDVADFYRIAPRYGTNDDMKTLIAEARKRDMRICLDLVAGHSSIDCEWFQKSASPEKNEYTDYYIWTDSVWGDYKSSGQRFINGFSDRDGCYAINFFYSQPALNYGFWEPDPKHPWQQPYDAPGPKAVRAELRKIMKFWLDMGASGFRVDMASSLVKNDPNSEGIIMLWKEIRDWLDKDYPETALIAEWCNPERAIAAGFDVDFMIHFGVSGYERLFFHKNVFSYEDYKPPFFSKEGKGDICAFTDNYMKQYNLTKADGYISVPTANHDFQRPNWNRDEADLRVIHTFIMTWPGVPVIYYGDEIGMKYLEGLRSKEGGYGRTGTRTPMQWSSDKNAGFSDGAEESLYLPIDSAENRPTVQAQEDDPESILNFMRSLTKLRNSSKALSADGGLDIVYAQSGKYPFVYTRYSGDERYLIVVNPAGRAESATIAGYLCPFTAAEAVVAGGVKVENNGKELLINAQPCSYGVFKIN